MCSTLLDSGALQKKVQCLSDIGFLRQGQPVTRIVEEWIRYSNVRVDPVGMRRDQRSALPISIRTPASFLPSESVRKFVGNLQRDHAAGNMRRNGLEHLTRVNALLIDFSTGKPGREATGRLRSKTLFSHGRPGSPHTSCLCKTETCRSKQALAANRGLYDPLAGARGRSWRAH